MVHLFEDCNLCAIHAKRVTISELGVYCCSCSFAEKNELKLHAPQEWLRGA